MKRSIAAILVVAALITLCSGCASLFEREQYIAREFTGEEQGADAALSGGIRSYAGLKAAISRIVGSYTENETLVFRNYDGEISDDLSRACQEVRSDTALGAYSVYYISFETPRRIVTYYETDIRVYYKKTREQVEGIISLSGEQTLYDTVESALSELRTYLAVMVTGGETDAEVLRKYVEEAYYSDPLGALLLPEDEISVYPDNGRQRIFEAAFDYGFDEETLKAMKRELNSALSKLIAFSADFEERARAVSAAKALSAAAVYDPDKSLSPSGSSPGPEMGDTAYGAAVEGYASSMGFAMAYKAMCDLLGIECVVVRGRLNKESHAWNILLIDGAYWHADVSLFTGPGESGLFKNDDGMQSYWWDTEAYPACDGSSPAEVSGETNQEDVNV